MQDLQRETEVNDYQLDTKIGEDDLYDLAGCFDCYSIESYLIKLQLDTRQRAQVEDLAKRGNVQVAMLKALRFWLQPNPYAATFRALLEISLDLKRGDVADKICQYISDNIPKSK